MAELIALPPLTPCAGLLPLEIGAAKLTEATPRLTSIMSYKGQSAALSEALQAASGLDLPAPNRMSQKGETMLQWFGRDTYLLTGEPDPNLVKHAALTDQSDAWAVTLLEGGSARDILARLTPLDLRPQMFKPGHTARSQIGHMMGAITCTDDNQFQIMVFRGFAATLVHELDVAMKAVAAKTGI